MTEQRNANNMFITGTKLLSDDIKPVRPLLPPILNFGEILMYYAPSGVGKTWLSLLLGLMACHGGKFLKWQFAQKVKVLFLDGEMGVNSLSNRYKSIWTSLSVEMDDDNFIACYPCADNDYETPNISDPRVQNFYNKKIVEEGINLLIVDSYSTCTSMLHDRDNEFAQWERVKKWLVRLKAHGISVIIVHHTNKGKQEQAGAEDRTRLLDTQLFLSASRFPLREEGTAFDITIEKSRNFHGDDTKKLHVQVLDVFSKSIIRCFDYEEMLIRNIGVESLPIGDIAAKYGISRWEAKHYKNITKGLTMPTNDQEGATPITDDEIEEVF